MHPFILDLDTVQSKGGKLNYLQHPRLPFEVKRMYWIYDFQEATWRGGHSHTRTERVLICMHGVIEVKLENREGKNFNFHLDSPARALYFPKNHWIDIKCGKGAVLLTLASTSFEDDDQENNYKTFLTSA
ncbi:WxcM-like domain-containing protein [Fulvivirga sp. M361]|uniref:sugar 3,4-ketoisomerase n=1 Tax=Fulvivirga sp. M361 TaxID=2594266 RepID=UPI001179F343|nr:FdtA/QdtA family cupin domain-containing protein [Fulvivirga sp. M361]TRX57789.1 WxcM-like domain-containing protein [Fulvivirga sp. M361]